MHITRPRALHPGLRRFQIIHSWPQLWSYLATVAIVAAVATILIHKDHDGPAHILAYAGAILAGSSISLLNANPKRFTVQADNPSQNARIAAALEAWLLRKRFVVFAVEGRTTRYRVNMPRLLRWDESNVHLTRGRDTIEVVAPAMVAKTLHAIARET